MEREGLVVLGVFELRPGEGGDGHREARVLLDAGAGGYVVLAWGDPLRNPERSAAPVEHRAGTLDEAFHVVLSSAARHVVDCGPEGRAVLRRLLGDEAAFAAGALTGEEMATRFLEARDDLRAVRNDRTDGWDPPESWDAVFEEAEALDRARGAPRPGV